MSHPRQLKLFRKWARAMEEGAIVDKPDYGKSLTATSKTKRRRTRRRRRRRLQRRLRRHKKEE